MIINHILKKMKVMIGQHNFYNNNNKINNQKIKKLYSNNNSNNNNNSNLNKLQSLDWFYWNKRKKEKIECKLYKISITEQFIFFY